MSNSSSVFSISFLSCGGIATVPVSVFTSAGEVDLLGDELPPPPPPPPPPELPPDDGLMLLSLSKVLLVSANHKMPKQVF